LRAFCDKTFYWNQHHVFSAKAFDDSLSHWRAAAELEKRSRDHLNARIIGRSFRAVPCQFVLPFGSCRGLCRSKKDRSRDLARHAALSEHVQSRAASRRGHRHAVVGCALLAGRDACAFPDTEPDIAELKSRIATAVKFIEGLPRDAIDGAADREVSFRFRSGMERSFTGRSLLLTFSMPQFFFHVTTAYDILRHAGVDLAKKDCLGAPRQV
jgi:Domain of unknown function (DUF1993)